MSFLINRVIFLFSILVLTGCRPEPAESISLFYSLDSLITSQVTHLAGNQVTVDKSAVIDGRNERIRLPETDSSWWQKELNIFGQLDLNRKPVNATLYERQTINDPESGMTVTRYVARKDIRQDVQVRYVDIFYSGSMKNIRRIEGEIKEDNAIYSSVRELSMELDNRNGHLVLVEYSVSGGQKMIVDDSVNFSITGRVIYP